MPRTLADRLSAPLAAADGPNLAFQDRCNRLVPRLWWPLEVPDPGRPMPAGAHALYLVHAYAIARLVRLPRGAAWAAGTLASWAAFTGAWDRRAAYSTSGPVSGVRSSSASA